ncbi:PKD domain-containing protein [Myxococcota bacterium]|nr:PKD domain-containing protein [Myxococcota bacterium]
MRSRPRTPPRIVAALAALGALCLLVPADATAACEFSVIRVLAEGLLPSDPAVLRVRDALRDGRLSTGSTTVEVGPGARADLVVGVAVTEAWGERFLVLERREGSLVVASQTLPMRGGGDNSGDVALALRSLVPCANTPPDVKVRQMPPGRAARGQEIALDACASTDPDGDALSYTWEQVGEEHAVSVNLDDPRRCVVEGLRLPLEGAYRFRLAVRDGVVTATRLVEVTVGTPVELRWRQAEGGAVGQPVRLDATLWDGATLTPAEDLRCDVLVAPGDRVPEVRPGAGSCTFDTPVPGWYRVRISARSRSGDEVSALAETWVAPRTPVPVRGDASVATLATALGSVDASLSVLMRTAETGSVPAAPGLRASARVLVFGRVGASWYPGEAGLQANSFFVGGDVLGFTRLLDPYRRFGLAPRQFALTLGVERWELKDEPGGRRGATLPFGEFRFEVLYGLHVAFRASPFPGPDRLYSLEIGLSLDELIGGIARLRKR